MHPAVAFRIEVLSHASTRLPAPSFFLMKLLRISFGVLCVGVGCFLMFRGPEGPADVSPSPRARSVAIPEAVAADRAAPAIARSDSPDQSEVAPTVPKLPTAATSVANNETAKSAAQTSFADQLLAHSTVLTNAFSQAGNATAFDAVETLLWSLANDQPETYASLTAWTWKERAWTEFASTPQPWMMQLGTPERLIAWAFINDFATVGGVQLIEHRIFGPNDEEVRLRLSHGNGSTSEEAFLMRRTDAGWQRVHVPSTVANVAAKLRGEKKPHPGR